jgi:hypothetical protein
MRRTAEDSCHSIFKNITTANPYPLEFIQTAMRLICLMAAERPIRFRNFKLSRRFSIAPVLRESLGDGFAQKRWCSRNQLRLHTCILHDFVA